jgi:uncharacterized FlaG/YvyC family protein
MSPLSAQEMPSQNQGRRAVASAVAAMNQSGLWPGMSLKIHYDMPTQRLTVQFIDSENNEVMYQIPSEDALRMAQELAGNPSASSGDHATPDSEE